MCDNCTKCNFTDSIFDNTINISNLDISSTSSTGNEPDIFDSLSNLRKQHPKRFICASLNINSLRNKFYSLQKLLLNNTVDLLFLLETKIDDSSRDISGIESVKHVDF